MKTIHILALFLFISLSWIACKDASGVQSETAAQSGPDSLFMAKKADAIHNIDAYASIMAEKVQALEGALSSTLDGSKESIEAELNKCKGIQQEVETIRKKVTDATPEIWEDVKVDFETMHYNVRMAVADSKVNKEKGGETAN